MHTKTLKKKIVLQRHKMERLIANGTPLHSALVVKESQKLDSLLNALYQKKLQQKG